MIHVLVYGLIWRDCVPESLKFDSPSLYPYFLAKIKILSTGHSISILCTPITLYRNDITESETLFSFLFLNIYIIVWIFEGKSEYHLLYSEILGSNVTPCLKPYTVSYLQSCV